MLTVKETADLLGVDRHTVYKLIAAGVVPCVKLSAQTWRIPRALLLQRLDEIAARGQSD